MTIEEKVICECYTNIAFCMGEERKEVYKYLSSKANRTVYTHEMLEVIKEHQEEIKKDFIDVCKGKYSMDS